MEGRCSLVSPVGGNGASLPSPKTGSGEPGLAQGIHGTFRKPSLSIETLRLLEIISIIRSSLSIEIILLNTLFIIKLK
jgi:hypothetical protein